MKVIYPNSCYSNKLLMIKTMHTLVANFVRPTWLFLSLVGSTLIVAVQACVMEENTRTHKASSRFVGDRQARRNSTLLWPDVVRRIAPSPHS